MNLIMTSPLGSMYPLTHVSLISIHHVTTDIIYTGMKYLIFKIHDIILYIVYCTVHAKIQYQSDIQISHI